MHVVLVYIKVDAERVAEFIPITLENARSSLREPGIARFDFLQMQDEPQRFMLVEVYRQPEDALKHKETAHYLKWRDAVAEMMAEPRRGIKYTNLSPSDEGWG
jgi:quinol monooxygenase YgiN